VGSLGQPNTAQVPTGPSNLEPVTGLPGQGQRCFCLSTSLSIPAKVCPGQALLPVRRGGVEAQVVVEGRALLQQGLCLGKLPLPKQRCRQV
jgi:hypothetical protein